MISATSWLWSASWHAVQERAMLRVGEHPVGEPAVRHAWLGERRRDHRSFCRVLDLVAIGAPREKSLAGIAIRILRSKKYLVIEILPLETSRCRANGSQDIASLIVRRRELAGGDLLILKRQAVQEQSYPLHIAVRDHEFRICGSKLSRWRNLPSLISHPPVVDAVRVRLVAVIAVQLPPVEQDRFAGEMQLMVELELSGSRNPALLIVEDDG